MRTLTILYDHGCPLCVRCRDWMSEQPAYVELEFLACGSPEARQRYGKVPWRGTELVVVSDEGDVWAGAAAFLIALWALRSWREWSYTLSGPSFAPLAGRFFRAVSAKRRRIPAWLGIGCADAERCPRAASRPGGCAAPRASRAAVENMGANHCAAGDCRVGEPYR